MESLHQLIHSLTPAEVKGVRAELRNGDYNKILPFFELLLDAEDSTSVSPSELKQLRGNNKIEEYDSLLEEIILDYLISRQNLQTYPESNGLLYAVLKSRKKRLHITYLTAVKQRSSIALKVIDDLIDLSKQYQLYEILAEVLVVKKNLLGLRKGSNVFNALRREIEYYRFAQWAVDRGLDLYYELMIYHTYKGNPDENQLKAFLQSAIEEVEGYLNRVPSAVLKYYLTIFKIDQAGAVGDYQNAVKLGFDKLKLLENSPVVFTSNRIGITYDDIATTQLMMGSNKPAYKHTRLAQQYFVFRSYNYYVAKRNEFLALFYDRKFKEAFAEINSLVKSSKYTPAGMHSTNVIYLAFTRFKLHDFKQALKLLSQPLEITSDKTGWDIAVRMLTIMTLIELKRRDEARMHIDKLRKHVERYSKKDHVTPRNRIINNALQTLARYEFSFTHPSMQKYIGQLKETGHAWKPLTPELIPFEQWLEEKMQLSRARSDQQSTINNQRA